MVIKQWNAANRAWRSTSVIEKHLPLMVSNCSRSWFVWANHYLRLNSPEQGLNTKKIIFFFLPLQFPKLQKLEVYCNFIRKLCQVNKFEVLEMNTPSLYLALVEILEDCIPPEMKAHWEQLQSKYCCDSSNGDASGNFFPSIAVASTKNMSREDMDSSQKSSHAHRCYVYVARLTAYCCHDDTSNKFNFSRPVAKVSKNLC